MNLDERIAAINSQLSKVRLRQKSKRLYLRAQLPIPDSEGSGKRRYELPTECPANLQGLAIAKSQANELERQLLYGIFSWDNWGKNSSPAQSKLVGDHITGFEQAHFEGKPRNHNSLDIYHQDYGRFFDWLPQDKPLSVAILKQVAESRSEDGSRSRFHCCRAYKALAKFAGLSPEGLTKLQGNYSIKSIRSKDIPSNDLILSAWQSIKLPHWRWAYGMLACFGLRNHELFFLDTSRMSEPDCWLQVAENTKTGYRLIRPYPEEWVDLMDLRNPKPLKNEVEGKTHRELGRCVTSSFRRMGIPFSPYALRHAYAVRLAVEGMSEAIAAKMMGHSIAIHCRHYQAFLNERHISEAFRKLKER